MKRLAALGFILLVSGCATKSYVRNTLKPVEDKANQVADQVARQDVDLAQVKQDVANNTTNIQAVNEKVTAADARAGNADTQATAAAQKNDQNAQEIARLKGMVSGLDNYKTASQATINFRPNAATLSSSDKQQLDQLVSNLASLKNYFVEIRGFTDNTGPAGYNLALSRRRADAALLYLVGQRDVASYRVGTVGLGEQSPADAGKTRQAKAKNRRVEIRVYSADGNATNTTSSLQ